MPAVAAATAAAVVAVVAVVAVAEIATAEAAAAVAASKVPFYEFTSDVIKAEQSSHETKLNALKSAFVHTCADPRREVQRRGGREEQEERRVHVRACVRACVRAFETVSTTPQWRRSLRTKRSRARVSAVRARM